MTSRDPFAWLKSRNPVPDPLSFPEPQSDPTAQALLQQIRSSPGAGPRGVRHRRLGRRLLIPVAVGAALATTAAAAWVLNRSPDDPTQVACYREADLSADIVALMTGPDPVAQCRQVWEAGTFSGSGGSPELAPCVLPSGIVGIFPAVESDPCGKLGLDAANLIPTRGSAAIVALQDSLADRFARSCASIDDAIAIVEDEIAAAGLDGWTVRKPEARPAERPCASVSIDVPARTVSVVPIPARPTG